MANYHDSLPSLYHDVRGYSFSTKALGFEPKEIYLSHSHKNVFRGYHISPYRKQAFVVSGRIIDRWFEPASNTLFESELGPGASVNIPANAMHGFYVLEDATVLYSLENRCIDHLEKTVHWSSPGLPFNTNLLSTAIISEKDRNSLFWMKKE